MIIECINCHKKFEVESSLIPESGRKIQCGSCNHIWFYKEIKNVAKDEIKIEDDNHINVEINKELDKNQTTKPPRIAPKLLPLPPTITITQIKKVYLIGL